MRAFIIPKHLGHTFKNSIISLPLKGKLTTNKEALAIHDSSHLATGAAVADFTSKASITAPHLPICKAISKLMLQVKCSYAS